MAVTISRGRCQRTEKPKVIVVTGCRIALTAVPRNSPIPRLPTPVRRLLACGRCSLEMRAFWESWAHEGASRHAAGSRSFRKDI